MEEQLLGTTLPVLSISLDPGESVVAEAGEFSWMTDSIQMSTGMGGGAGGSGIVGALKRAAGGSTLFLSTYTATDAPGSSRSRRSCPAASSASTSARGSEYLVHRHGFLAGTPGIRDLRRVSSSPSPPESSRGEGFVLQRIGGQGRAWIELAGEVVTYDLAPGESLRVHPGHVGMFTASVSFQVMRVPGVANRYFGGDAHHFAVLSGPGAVWLQSMPLPVLAASLAPYLPQAQGRAAHSATESGVVGGIIGDLLR